MTIPPGKSATTGLSDRQDLLPEFGDSLMQYSWTPSLTFPCGI